MHHIHYSTRNSLTVSLMFFATLALSSCTEYLPISSGALSGTATETPAQWTDVAPVEIIQLETGGEDAYSVNLWVVELGGNLHVFAGDNRATWVENIEANDDVRLRANDLIYSLRATRVTDAPTFEVFAQAWEAKYGNRPRNENVDETYLFRLNPR
ncbi:MAG: hypothetical protein P8R02_00015 [Pseudomonadales bacterium]|nr:hypothetical protein [Pseudomonadales bacterium]